jgi:hypothetical protein
MKEILWRASLLGWLAIHNSLAEVEQNLTAVTSLLGSEEYYLEVRRRSKFADAVSSTSSNATTDECVQSPLPDNVSDRVQSRPREEKQETKEAICATIFSSALFDDTHQVYPVDQIERAMIYKHASTNSTIHDDLSYPTLYQLREITALERTVPEFVFPCLTRMQRSTKNLVKYFVSQEYVISPARREPCETSVRLGRFVFAYDKNSGKLVPVAVAENPPEIHFDEDSYHWASILERWLHRRPDGKPINPLTLPGKYRFHFTILHQIHLW